MRKRIHRGTALLLILAQIFCGRPLRANDSYSNVFYHIAPPETAHKDVDEIVNGVRYTGIWKIAAVGFSWTIPAFKILAQDGGQQWSPC